MSVNVAVVGCGYWGPNLIRNFREVEGCGPVACCDLDPETRGRVGYLAERQLLRESSSREILGSTGEQRCEGPAGRVGLNRSASEMSRNARAPQCLDARHELVGTAVRQVVPVDRGDHHVP